MRLMTTPFRFVLSRLSRTLYLEFLAKARAGGRAVVQFRDFLSLEPALPRYIVLRQSGTLRPTVIEDHAKIDDNVEFAHNAVIKTGASVTGGVVIGGRAVVGRDAWIGIKRRERRLGGAGASPRRSTPPVRRRLHGDRIRVAVETSMLSGQLNTGRRCMRARLCVTAFILGVLFIALPGQSTLGQQAQRKGRLNRLATLLDEDKAV